MFPGYKCNMTDILASIGLAQLERYPELLKKRRELIESYDLLLRPRGIDALVHYGPSFASSGHLYMVRIPGIDEGQRNGIIIRMAEAGVACNVHYKPLPMLTAYRNLGFDINDYRNALKQYENEITLPLHTSLTTEDLEWVSRSLQTQCSS